MIVQQIPKQAEKKNREKEHTPSAVDTRRRRSALSRRERCKFQLLSLQLTRRRRKAMPNSPTNNAPPLALILVKRLAQASDLPKKNHQSHASPPVLTLYASISKQNRGKKPTSSSVHAPPFALSFVQYRTCSVPLLLPGKNSAICFQVISCCSFSSVSSASSSSVNLVFGPECGRGWGGDEGCCGW